MEKFDFKIPTNTIKIAKNDSSQLIEQNNNIKLKNYFKITENVYKFGNSNILFDENLKYSDWPNLFAVACELKENDNEKSIELLKKCEKMINDQISNEQKYELYINIALAITARNVFNIEVCKYYDKAIKLFPDRGEAYFYCAIFNNKYQNYEVAFELLNCALKLSYSDALAKYPKTPFSAYGKFLYDELAVSCYWLKKYTESRDLILEIIDDPLFKNERDRLQANLDFANKNIME